MHFIIEFGEAKVKNRFTCRQQMSQQQASKKKRLENPGPQTLIFCSSFPSSQETHLSMLRYITASLGKPVPTTLKCHSVIRPIKNTPCQFRTYATGKKTESESERERDDHLTSYCQNSNISILNR